MNNQIRTGRALSLLALTLGLLSCTELAYRHMNDPSRDAWQKPKEVVNALAIKPGSVVADIGAGGGYFAWYLAEAVGRQGTVYAVEIDETALQILKEQMRDRGIMNVTPVHAEPHDAKLPAPVDLVFNCDTYHHMSDRVAYFRSLAPFLKPGARVAILDFSPHGLFSGLLGHGTAEEVVRREMEAAGYQFMMSYDFLGSQHFQVFSRKDS